MTNETSRPQHAPSTEHGENRSGTAQRDVVQQKEHEKNVKDMHQVHEMQRMLRLDSLLLQRQWKQRDKETTCAKSDD